MKSKGLALLTCALAVGLAGAGAASAKRSDTTITGAGSSLVAPLVSQWVGPVGSAFGYTLNYASVGSGTGIAQITARTVDFGASDAPLTADQAAKCNNCYQIPWALSATVPSYNIPGAPNDLHLTGPIIAGIFLGKITNWSDPQIKKINPKVSLPDLKITPVHRSDGSGDTYAFTDYLSRVSTEFKSQVGNATLVSWPGGLGGNGNAGVAGIVSNTPGAVGYISVAYILQNHLKMAAVLNNSGKYATAGLRGIAAAAQAVKTVPANNEMHIVNPPKSTDKNAKLAYPISTFTYVIVPATTPHAAELRKFVFWALTQGQKYGPKLIFAPLPKQVLVAAEKTLKKIQPGT